MSAHCMASYYCPSSLKSFVWFFVMLPPTAFILLFPLSPYLFSLSICPYFLGFHPVHCIDDFTFVSMATSFCFLFPICFHSDSVFLILVPVVHSEASFICLHHTCLVLQDRYRCCYKFCNDKRGRFE